MSASGDVNETLITKRHNIEQIHFTSYCLFPDVIDYFGGKLCLRLARVRILTEKKYFIFQNEEDIRLQLLQ